MTPARNFDSGIEIANSSRSSSSNIIAVKAAQVATAAHDAQSNAAESAAKEAHNQLAEKAAQASKAVQAVLNGKRALLENIEKELKIDEELLAKLRGSLQHSERAAEKTECAAKKAEDDLNRLREIVRLLSGNVATVNALNEQAQIDYNEKVQMLMAAKDRSKRIHKDIACARDDYQKVKDAADQAASAAVQAKQKAVQTVTVDRRTIQALLRRRRQQHPFWSETIFS
ncbi:laminin subunit gamma-1 [Drosophila navojoa]|uniref:laminin subunit gamma-1 n=1 Tax=Drosophila navojoa TaxID=7232 RepID=UPI000846F8CD|nr:laminin subunit gamma-1 [Drosophila navojoa]